MLLLGLLLAGVGHPAQAELSVLSESEMSDLTGGLGLNIPAGQTVGLTLSMDQLYYHDTDGTDSASQGSYLSLCGVRMDGAIAAGSAVTMLFGDFASLLDGTLVTGINMVIDDMTIRIEQLDIDAIRVGDSLATGLSFGGIGIQNMVLQMSGKIQVYTH